MWDWLHQVAKWVMGAWATLLGAPPDSSSTSEPTTGTPLLSVSKENFQSYVEPLRETDVARSWSPRQPYNPDLVEERRARAALLRMYR